MSLPRTAAVLFLLAPFAIGANKDIQELQRDVAMLQDQVRNMQRSIDEKFGAMQTMLQQTLDSANRTNTAVAVMQSRFNDAVKEQQNSMGPQINNVGQKLRRQPCAVRDPSPVRPSPRGPGGDHLHERLSRLQSRKE
jgi:hypothetical protein